MIVSNFKKITIGDKNLIIKYKRKESKEILLSDIKKIYIKIKKVPLKYMMLFVGVSLSVVLLLGWQFGYNLLVLSPSFLILVGVIKMNTYKRYVLKIKLNNGYSIIQPIPLKSKYNTIECINKVRKAQLGMNPELKI